LAREEPIWVNIGKIWGIFTDFSNFGQKTDHLVFFVAFLKSAENFLQLRPFKNQGFTALGQFWPNLGHFTVFCYFVQKTDHLILFLRF